MIVVLLFPTKSDSSRVGVVKFGLGTLPLLVCTNFFGHATFGLQTRHMKVNTQAFLHSGPRLRAPFGEEKARVKEFGGCRKPLPSGVGLVAFGVSHDGPKEPKVSFGQSWFWPEMVGQTWFWPKKMAKLRLVIAG